MKKAGIFLLCILLSISFIKLINASSEGEINIQISGENECMLNFNKGWNFFSFCENLANNDPNAVFLSLEGRYRYVMKWDPIVQEFDIFSPKSTKAPIPNLDDNESYFIYLYNIEGLEVEGNPALNELRYLTKGWNAPSYQLGFSTFISVLTSSIKDKYRYIMKWNSTAQEFDIFSPKSTKSAFNAIYKGEGFFIYAINESALII